MKKKQEWLEQDYAAATSKFPERDYPSRTLSDIEADPVYTLEDVAEFDPDEKLGYPGEYPYTRGVQASMYRGKLWTMRQFAGMGSAEETNARFKKLLSAGQTGLSTAFDLPTLMGYDSDHPFSRGEVGKCGVAVTSLADMEALFDGIDPEAVTTSMTINSPANAIWAMYLAMAEKRGADLEKVGGTLQNDILKEFIAQKEYIYPPEPSVKLVIDTFEWGPKHVPRWNFISVSGYHIREAGSTAVQELAFTLADGIHYVRKALERGLDIDEFAPRISFFLQRPQRLLRRNCQIPRRAAHLGASDARGLRREKSEVLDAPHPRADRRGGADGAAAAGQHRPRRHSSPGRGFGRDQLTPH